MSRTPAHAVRSLHAALLLPAGPLVVGLHLGFAGASVVSIGEPFRNLADYLAQWLKMGLLASVLAAIPLVVPVVLLAAALEGAVIRGRASTASAQRRARAALGVLAASAGATVLWSLVAALSSASTPGCRFTWSPKPDWLASPFLGFVANPILLFTIWVLAVVAALWAAMAVHPWGPNRCTSCGYSVERLPTDRCPECGKPWGEYP